MIKQHGITNGYLSKFKVVYFNWYFLCCFCHHLIQIFGVSVRNWHQFSFWFWSNVSPKKRSLLCSVYFQEKVVIILEKGQLLRGDGHAILVFEKRLFAYIRMYTYIDFVQILVHFASVRIIEWCLSPFYRSIAIE